MKRILRLNLTWISVTIVMIMVLCWVSLWIFSLPVSVSACETEIVTGTLVDWTPAWTMTFTERLARYPWVNDHWLAVETRHVRQFSNYDQFHFLDPQSGAIIWQYPTQATSWMPVTTINSEYLAFSELENTYTISALAPQETRLLWKARDINPHAGIFMTNDSLYVRSRTRALQAYDLASGNLRWETAEQSMRGDSGILAYGSEILTVVGNTQLTYYSITSGVPITVENIDTPRVNYASLALDNLLLLASAQQITAYDLLSEQILWTETVSTTSRIEPYLYRLWPPAFDENYVYVLPTPTRLVALRLNDGNLAWEVNLQTGDYVAPPVLLDKYLFTMKSDGSVTQIDITTQKSVGQLLVNMPITDDTIDFKSYLPGLTAYGPYLYMTFGCNKLHAFMKN